MRVKFAAVYLIFFIVWHQVNAQSYPIDVFESTLKVAGFSEEAFYYGFAEGDQLVFNFEEVKGAAA